MTPVVILSPTVFAAVEAFRKFCTETYPKLGDTYVEIMEDDMDWNALCVGFLFARNVPVDLVFELAGMIRFGCQYWMGDGTLVFRMDTSLRDHQYVEGEE